MPYRALLFMAIIFMSLPFPSYGQTGFEQPLTDPQIQHNMGTISGMMQEIHLIMHQGHLTPKQAGEISEIMTRLAAMMKEMSGPQAEQLAPGHERELQEIRRLLENLKIQIKRQ
jgi:hypothetical protein